MALRKLIRSTGWSLLLALLAAVGGAPPASAQTWQLVGGLARDVGVGGWHRVFSIPANAINIHLQIWDYAATINPWVTVIDKTYPLPPNECVKVYGTTLSPQYDSECS